MRNRAHFSRERRRLAFPIWFHLSCHPVRFMASPLLGWVRVSCTLLLGESRRARSRESPSDAVVLPEAYQGAAARRPEAVICSR